MAESKIHYVGQLQKTGKRPENVELFVDKRADLTQAEASAGIEWVDSRYAPGDIRRYGAVGDDSTDNAGPIKRAVDSNKWVYVPEGTFVIDSTVTISADDVTVYGESHASIIKAGANNLALLTVTGDRAQVNNLKLLGDATSSASTNGIGIYLNNGEDFKSIDVFFDNFGYGGITGIASSAVKKGPHLERPKFRNSVAGTEIYLGGLWRDIMVIDADGVTSTSDRLFLAFDNSTAGWQGVTIRGGYAEGYQKQAVGGTDESPNAAADRIWTFVVDGMRFEDINWSAIKTKNCLNVKLVNNTIRNSGLVAEDFNSGLYGDILANSQGQVLIDSNTFENSGSDAIRCAANTAGIGGTLPDGTGRAQFTITNNHIRNTGEEVASAGNGVAIVGGSSLVLISDNTFTGVERHVIEVNATADADDRPAWEAGIFNNAMNRNPGANLGIRASYIDQLRIDGNVNRDGGATGVQINDCRLVTIGSNDVVIDPALGSGRGYQITDCNVVRFYATAGNSEYDQWTASTAYVLGDRVYNGANVYECTVAGTSAGSGGPTATSGEQTDNTVTWCYVGKYQLLPYGVRLTGTNDDCEIAGHFPNVLTREFENLTGGARLHFNTNFQTTAAGPTTAITLPLPDESAWMITLRAVGKKSDTTDRAMYQRSALIYRDGGSATLQGSVQDVITAVESNASWNATIGTSGNNAYVPLTGIAATTIDWKLVIEADSR